MAQTNGHVRVLVLLNGPAVATQARPDAAAIASAKARVAAMQDTVLARHFGDARNLRPGQGFDRRHTRFEITPGFAIEVDASELEALAADPLVKTINIDRAMPPTLLQSVPLIGQPAAYSNGATGAGWAVAVLDTGVQTNHEFLSGKVVAEACFSNAGGAGGQVSLCPNGLSSQTGAGAANSTTANCINGSTNLCQHGTHVSGIAAGLNTSQSAGEPTNGVARDGNIFAVQIFTRFNASADCSPGAAPCVLSYTSDQILALDYVFQHLTPVVGVNVASVNMSLGGGPNTSSACDGDSQKPAIDNLRAAGVLTAIAAGNDGSKTLISHPGCISSAVAVGSTTKGDVVSSFSNMATIVALLAPGGFGGGGCSFGGNNPDILSSFPGISSATTNLYACEAGTSMATPHVAGAIAAIRAACPNSTANAILSAFQTSGISITDTRSGAPGTITKPRIQLDAALAVLACNASAGSIAVSPNTDIETGGPQGGPFTPASFNYTLTASPGSENYAITGVPTWLTPSSTSGTATTSGTAVSFTVNSNANALSSGIYTATITFTDTTSNTTALTISAVLAVDDAAVLQVSPSTNMASVGNPGGPFSPSSFQYQLSTNSGTIGYSIAGLPSWLNASSTSGTLTTSPTTITFTVNSNANSLPFGGYNATVSFANTTNGQGDQTRNAALTVNSGGAAPPAPRTWVSGAGDDANDCTLTAPCLTFAGAISKTAAGGEIDCLDAGGFGVVTIDKSITIDCGTSPGGILSSGTDGIVINAGAADRIVLRNLVIDGTGTGTNGVRFLAGRSLSLDRVVIQQVTGVGLDIAQTQSARLILKHVLITQGGTGIKSTTSAGAINGTIDDVKIFRMSGHGLQAISNTFLTIQNLNSSRNGGDGVRSEAATVGLNVQDSTVHGNNFGFNAVAGNIRLHANLMTFNNANLSSNVMSDGTNRSTGNTTTNAPTPGAFTIN